MPKYICVETGRYYHDIIWGAIELGTKGVCVSLGVKDDKYDPKDFITYLVKRGGKAFLFFREIHGLDLSKLDSILDKELEELKMWGLVPIKDRQSIISLG